LQGHGIRTVSPLVAGYDMLEADREHKGGGFHPLLAGDANEPGGSLCCRWLRIWL
jgi:hypothetical protein